MSQSEPVQRIWQAIIWLHSTTGLSQRCPWRQTGSPMAGLNPEQHRGISMRTACGRSHYYLPAMKEIIAAMLAFSSGGTNIQFYQNGVTLEGNTHYRLSFAAYSTTGHD